MPHISPSLSIIYKEAWLRPSCSFDPISISRYWYVHYPRYQQIPSYALSARPLPRSKMNHEITSPQNPPRYSHRNSSGAVSAAALANQSPTLVQVPGHRCATAIASMERARSNARRCVNCRNMRSAGGRPPVIRRFPCEGIASHDSNSNSHSRKTNRTEEARR